MITLLLAIIYLAFVSLGLPDALLGASWPTISTLWGIPVSYLGIVSAIICCGTVSSSLLSDRLTRRFGTGVVTAVSVGTTAIALLGFSFSSSFWMICLIAIPYGLGAGGVDAALNNYVALHYSSTHMSWLHCMWGVGASIGPYIMAYALTGASWSDGYMYVFVLQAGLTAVLILSLPLWKKVNTKWATTDNSTEEGSDNTTNSKPLSIKQILSIPGTKPLMLAFFCYCAIESTVGIYASSYLVTHRGIDATTAAQWASWYYIGITAGRAVSGFVTMKLSDKAMIRGGQGIMIVGLLLILLPLSTYTAMVGLILTGIGSAPIYPCIIHSTPDNFGRENSQAITGVQMASAYLGSLIMPPLFGIIAQYINISLYPVYILLLVVVMIIMTQLLYNTTAKSKLASN